MNEQDYKEYQALISEGHSQRSAAKILGIDRCKIQRYIKKQLEVEEDNKPLEKNSFDMSDYIEHFLMA